MSQFSQISYSQDGLDIALKNAMKNENIVDGFYVDIGAHHPERFSQTKLLNEKGWRGINIEPTPSLYKEFQEQRPNDINVNAALDKCTHEVVFYEFEEPALNTIYEERMKMRVEQKFNIKEVKKIFAYSLKDLLDKYMPLNQEITFLSMDTQGNEYDILLTNDWDKYKPRYLAVGVLDADFYDIKDSGIGKLLSKNNYQPIMKMAFRTIFKRID